MNLQQQIEKSPSGIHKAQDFCKWLTVLGKYSYFLNHPLISRFSRSGLELWPYQIPAVACVTLTHNLFLQQIVQHCNTLMQSSSSYLGGNTITTWLKGSLLIVLFTTVPEQFKLDRKILFTVVPKLTTDVQRRPVTNVYLKFIFPESQLKFKHFNCCKTAFKWPK